MRTTLAALGILLVFGATSSCKVEVDGVDNSSEPAELLFEDDFNRADGPVNADPNWTTMADPA